VSDARPTIRLDKWLYYARFFKTRGLATATVAAGHVRVDGSRVVKAARQVGAGDTLTFLQGRRIRVVTILSPGHRRGPASEAQLLYRDLTPPSEPTPAAPKFAGRGRPTKKDRRSLPGRMGYDLE